eukprot:TRINITY_DN6460_c0_g1_i1.p1 TRINITY_DN6460_c0_g1~~TRINITY_DN6460_c0_g1_i1.p1  ORF type:complete len:330 (-),score=78.24 TRINITY_DN6460_c0_g1_i1:116-1105(-)
MATTQQLSAWSMFAVFQWWLTNIGTILFNKYIFKIVGFHFPLTLTLIHFTTCFIGAFLTLKVFKVFDQVNVEASDKWGKIFPISIAFALSIILGNISLEAVPVSFMQTIKALTPVSTVGLQYVISKKRFPRSVWLSLIPICGGIVLASATELSFAWIGFCGAILSCLGTSSKAILAESLLQGKYKFDPINTVYHLTPTAIVILIPFAVLVEGSAVVEWVSVNVLAPDAPKPHTPFLLLASGLLAFALNFSIFLVIQKTSAVTFNVVGNAKVAIAILLSWFMFENPMSIWSAVGCSITILGCFVYGHLRSSAQLPVKEKAEDGVGKALAP